MDTPSEEGKKNAEKPNDNHHRGTFDDLDLDPDYVSTTGDLGEPLGVG